MMQKSARIDPDQLEQIHAIRLAYQMAREEEIEKQRRLLQKCNAEHMETILDGVADHGVEIIQHPIVQQSSRTIGHKVVHYHTRIFVNPQ